MESGGKDLGVDLGWTLEFQAIWAHTLPPSGIDKINHLCLIL